MDEAPNVVGLPIPSRGLASVRRPSPLSRRAAPHEIERPEGARHATAAHEKGPVHAVLKPSRPLWRRGVFLPHARRVALEERGRTIYNLSVGTPDFAPYPHVVEALTEAAQDPQMWKYSLRDVPELKQAVCDYYARRFGVEGITPDMVASCNGTQEGVGHLGLALLDPGDTILVPDPCYPVFEAGAKIADAELAYYPLDAEHDFLPYVAGIDPAVADRAKYMIVSLPANPVGLWATMPSTTRSSRSRASTTCSSCTTTRTPTSSSTARAAARSSRIPARSRLAWSSSRFPNRSNVTGARIGFLVGRPDVVAAFAKLRSQIDFGMFLPIQKAAIAALAGPLEEVEEQRLTYQERRDALCDGLERLGWERPNAHGSMFVWVKLPGGRTDSMAFCEELMEKAGVIVTPGASFGPHGEGYVRMALVLPPEGLERAVAAIEEAGILG